MYVTVLDVCADNIKSWRETLNNVEEGEKESISCIRYASKISQYPQYIPPVTKNA
jgi:hypothetical protein